VQSLALTLTSPPPPARAEATQPDRAPAVDPGGVADRATPAARRWVALAVMSLVISGLLSLSVVLGRLPGISHLISDPLFFKRCLVVHVNLALVVWFYAFIAGLAAMTTRGVPSRLGAGAFAGAVLGVVLMLAGALAPGAAPILANYIPVIDHPLFLSGLALVGLSILVQAALLVAAPLAHPSTSGMPVEVAIGLRAALVALLLAGVTWAATQSRLPAGVDRLFTFEFSAWGAGHVLQVANVCAMLAIWLWLVARLTGHSLVGRRGALALFGVLLAPHLSAPLLAGLPALRHQYFHGSTELMRWGIFPVVLVTLGLILAHLARHRGGAEDASARALWAGLRASVGLTVLGFILGAMIRDSSTLVPAHYHAALGGITASLMAVAYLVAARIALEDGRGERSSQFWRWARIQLIAFGVGQAVFAVGFGIGGLHGLGRKEYASEQSRSLGEIAGLSVMGIGGLLATVAGVLFLVLILRELRHWWRTPSRPAAPSPSSTSP